MYYKKGEFLSTDNKILKILLQAKKEGNPLLKYFEIKYPDKTLNEDNNIIHVACVSAENHKPGLEHQQFRDLVEIVITTKKLEYSRAIKVIKTISSEIIRLIKNDDYLSQRLIVNSISPVHSTDTYTLKKGHILLQFITGPVQFNEPDEETINCVHKILTNNIEVK